ncbi:sulfur carrier protein ThiS [bacterium BFN5]|nr:sulfur carrier protein ThiS [bacterium BFN5]QJW49181.1 sulfur carrier protein ThiS [bacterium BFN5]
MELTVNGKILEFQEELSIAMLVEKKGFNPETIIIELNYEIIKREKWDETILKQNDHLEVLTFVGGG